MLIESQKISIKWSTSNKEWYESKGYHFTKYKDEFIVDVKDLTPGSRARVKVVCDYCGREYECCYYAYTNGRSKYPKDACSKCSGKKAQEVNVDKRAQKRYNDVIKIFSKNGYTLLSDIADFYNIYNKIKYICPKHGIIESTLGNILHGRLCKKCGYETTGNKLRLSVDNIEQEILAKNSIWLNKRDYKDAHLKNLKIQCLDCKSIFTTNLSNFRKMICGCPNCGKEKAAKDKMLNHDTVENIINSLNGNILLNKQDYIGNSVNNLKVKCGICGNIFTTALAGYKDKKFVCPECIKRNISEIKKYSCDEVENIINSVGGNKLLNKNEYVGNSVVNLRIQCGRCGKTFTTSLASYKRGKIMCDSCSQKESKNEEKIRMLLEDLNIDYEQEKTFPDCRDKLPLPFDFYLPKYNILCEYDGEGHYLEKFYESRFTNSKEALEHTQYHDQIKTQYCKDNNIPLLRIPYWEKDNIENIVLDYLKLYGYKDKNK